MPEIFYGNGAGKWPLTFLRIERKLCCVQEIVLSILRKAGARRMWKVHYTFNLVGVQKAMNNPKFYEVHFYKAVEIVKNQIDEAWSQAEIASYWYNLGYDIFFFNKLKSHPEIKWFFDQ